MADETTTMASFRFAPGELDALDRIVEWDRSQAPAELARSVSRTSTLRRLIAEAEASIPNGLPATVDDTKLSREA